MQDCWNGQEPELSTWMLKSTETQQQHEHHGRVGTYSIKTKGEGDGRVEMGLLRLAWMEVMGLKAVPFLYGTVCDALSFLFLLLNALNVNVKQ